MIRIDHIGVPARDRLDSARFLTRLLGLHWEIPDDGRFAPVRAPGGHLSEVMSSASGAGTT
jgi:hypothetical protein